MNFWITAMRNGHLATELWHVCLNGGYDLEKRRMKRAPREGATFECPKCNTGMGR